MMNNNSFNLNEKDLDIISVLTPFVVQSQKNKIISLSYNQVADFVCVKTGFKISPKSAKRYLDILTKLNILVCIAKPFKSKRKYCIGRAKSLYAVSEQKENIIQFNALEVARSIDDLNITDRQIVGKLTYTQFFAFFKFYFDIVPKLYTFVHQMLNALHQKWSQFYSLYYSNIEYSNFNYIVYPGYFMYGFENMFKYLQKHKFKLQSQI